MKHGILGRYNPVAIILFTASCGAGVQAVGQADNPSGQVPMQPRIEEALAPGTAKVFARIMSIDSTKSRTILTIRIDKILSYGSATPILIPGSSITAPVPPGATFALPDEVGGIAILLRYLQPGRGAISRRETWQIIWIYPPH